MLNGTGTSIKAHGTIPISDTANWDAVVSIHSSLRSISILQQVPGLGDNGTVNVEFILQGTILKPQWKFMSIAENISPYSIPLRSVSIKGHLLDSLIQTSTRFLSSDLSATVVFNATVESLLTVHSLNRYIATIQIDTLSSTILKKLNLSLRKFPSGYFSAYSEIHGSSIQWPDSIKTNLTFHSNKLVYPLSATIKMHSHSWNSSIKWGKNRISGKGILLNNGEIYGTILSHFSDPSLISHLFINQIITGALSVSSKLSGSLNNLSMVSRFSNGRLQWKSIQFTILNGGINLSKSGILFSDIDFSAEGPVHDALRYLNIDSVDGYLNSKIKVSGSLTKPVINVALNVSDLSYKN